MAEMTVRVEGPVEVTGGGTPTPSSGPVSVLVDPFTGNDERVSGTGISAGSDTTIITIPAGRTWYGTVGITAVWGAGGTDPVLVDIHTNDGDAFPPVNVPIVALLLSGEAAGGQNTRDNVKIIAGPNSPCDVVLAMDTPTADANAWMYGVLLPA